MQAKGDVIVVQVPASEFVRSSASYHQHSTNIRVRDDFLTILLDIRH
jgi:hypothetical protein